MTIPLHQIVSEFIEAIGKNESFEMILTNVKRH